MAPSSWANIDSGNGFSHDVAITWINVDFSTKRSLVNHMMAIPRGKYWRYHQIMCFQMTHGKFQPDLQGVNEAINQWTHTFLHHRICLCGSDTVNRPSFSPSCSVEVMTPVTYCSMVQLSPDVPIFDNVPWSTKWCVKRFISRRVSGDVLKHTVHHSSHT